MPLDHNALLPGLRVAYGPVGLPGTLTARADLWSAWVKFDHEVRRSGWSKTSASRCPLVDLRALDRWAPNPLCLPPARFPVYRSDGGGYLCRWLGTSGDYEAWTADGSIHWRHDDLARDDPAAAFPLRWVVIRYQVALYDQPRGTFTLTLAHCDVRVRVIPWTGNAVLESRPVTFRRRVPWRQTPRWLKAAVEGVVAEDPTDA